MSDKPRILIQLDPDPHPSVFDSVVAVDSGVQHLISHGDVKPEQVTALVHGAIFTRGPADLKNTAIFVGGSDVAVGAAILRAATKAFLGPLRVSIMLDANGANTTAAAAVLVARRHLDLSGAVAVVLAGTGPVGQRAARLLAREGARVRLASRSLDRSSEAAASISAALGSLQSGRELHPVKAVATANDAALRQALDGAQVVIAAGAAGARLLPAALWRESKSTRVLIDLNAVPPSGIEEIEVMDKAKDRQGVTCYGAIGVGGTKMKIHKAAIASLFETNDKVLDAEAIFDLAKTLA